MVSGFAQEDSVQVPLPVEAGFIFLTSLALVSMQPHTNGYQIIFWNCFGSIGNNEGNWPPYLTNRSLDYGKA